MDDHSETPFKLVTIEPGPKTVGRYQIVDARGELVATVPFETPTHSREEQKANAELLASLGRD